MQHDQFRIGVSGLGDDGVLAAEDGALPPNKICRKQPSVSAERVPATTGNCRAPSHCDSVRLPSVGLIQAISSPSPKVVGSACGVGLLSSRPIQNTARCWPVKPANQLSRKSLLVPVLPAACNHFRFESPIAWAARA